MKCVQILCIQLDNLVRRCEHFSHQSIFGTKVNIGGLIDSIEFCGVRTTKECTVRLVFLESKLIESFEVFQ